MMKQKKHSVILIHCPDRTGIVARVSEYIFRSGANIIQADQYSTDPEGGAFFMRVEFYFDEEKISSADFAAGFELIAQELNARWQIHYMDRRPRMGILVSKEDHCLLDLLFRYRRGELSVDIPFVISNHNIHAAQVQALGIAFQHITATAENRPSAESEILKLVCGQTDFLVLARYMQILSGTFLKSYGLDVINIHHSFLPSFKGASPYRQAYERGVKVIGATAHYVTENLDEGPIIAQVVQPVSHRDDVNALVRKGRDSERLALANAVQAHIEHRVIRYQNRTIVFE